ncbi:hypothetical protein CDEST_06665 [Colletotrichum destructivum]|uniref:Zn(2)-C6 fungal-type domain-containing protein n=1 Tax=Colletotrichum destructivum TaxID=34406 RepID=A0AAX4IE46_9PEZI|nr:hypothetical protein CDEST_06665 [Colletotrichum destructivum]
MSFESDKRPSKRQRDPEPSADAARASTACEACRDRKIKCSGNHPCRYCARRQIPCTFREAVKKKLYAVEYVAHLEELAACVRGRGSKPSGNAPLGRRSPSQVAVNDGEISPQPMPVFDSNRSIHSESLPVPSLSPGKPSVSLGHIEEEDRNVNKQLESTPDLAGSINSSSLYFSHQIKSLKSGCSAGPRYGPSTRQQSPDWPENVYGIPPPKRGGESRDGDRHTVDLPGLQEAQELLDTVLNSLGNIQHLFEPRAFCDRLSEFYSTAVDKTDIWYVELLIVLAVGKLLRGKPGGGGTLPGTDLYQEAERHLPGMMTLRRQGTTAVEILGMMAFYLQCADLRDDAYVYAGMALRLAMSNGMANSSSYSGLRRSEKAHRCRLWWTIYMQERRLAAATGQPLTIQDASISTEYPGEAPGFVTPAAMIVNIELARITGQTMDVVYGTKGKAVDRYVESVRKILKQLQDVAKSIPSEYTLNLTRAPRLSRTAGTLYLMLHQAMQCIVLATRPTLLHLARNRLDVAKSVTKNTVSMWELDQISGSCVEAASCSLEVLDAMKEQRIIANFGFFDLDAAFSAAFVFVLVDSIHARASHPSSIVQIRKASEILKHLASQGNFAAQKRRADINQMCSHLGVSFNEDADERADISPMEIDGVRVNEAGTDDADGQTQHHQHDEDGRLIPFRSRDQDLHRVEDTVLQHELPSSSQLDWAQAAATLLDHSLADTQDQQQSMAAALSFGEGGNEMLGGLYLEDFSLTGVVETDWAEFARQLASQNELGG